MTPLAERYPVKLSGRREHLWIVREALTAAEVAQIADRLAKTRRASAARALLAWHATRRVVPLYSLPRNGGES